MSDIVERLNGNGEPWTFAEITDEIASLRAENKRLEAAALSAIEAAGMSYNSGLEYAANICAELPHKILNAEPFYVDGCNHCAERIRAMNTERE